MRRGGEHSLVSYMSLWCGKFLHLKIENRRFDYLYNSVI